MVALVKLQQSFRTEMKHHKGILYNNFMFLSKTYRIIESKKNCKFFRISKYMLLCKMVAMVIFHQFLSAGHVMSNVAKQKSYL